MIVVFGGPSIYGIDADMLDGIDVRPPALCGDLLKAAHDGARVIGLIDGVFESVPSVWHKEILFALSRGIAVLGSSSMGALRAAECRAFGMVGVGRIFEDYAAGRRIADADVAVVHAPAELGFQPLSLSLVDAEHRLGQIRQSGAMTAEDFELLLHAARASHFKDRTWRSLIDRAISNERQAEALLGLVSGADHSLKTLDAIELLFRLRSRRCGARRGETFDFNRTQYFDRLRDAISG